MRALFLAVALLFVAPVSGCANLRNTVEQVTPQTPREALAVAEVTFVGAVEVARSLNNRGVIDAAEGRRLLATFQRVDMLLTQARRFIQVGELVAAGQNIDAALVVLRVVSNELVRRAEAAGSVPA